MKVGIKSWNRWTSDIANLDEEIREAERKLAKLKKKRNKMSADWAAHRLFIFQLRKNLK